MNAAIVGEDQVTREIIKKLISIYAPHLTQLNEIPARGSQALNAVNVEISFKHPCYIINGFR